jgi:hypothetical protein
MGLHASLPLCSVILWLLPSQNVTGLVTEKLSSFARCDCVRIDRARQHILGSTPANCMARSTSTYVIWPLPDLGDEDWDFESAASIERAPEPLIMIASAMAIARM